MKRIHLLINVFINPRTFRSKFVEMNSYLRTIRPNVYGENATLTIRIY